MKTWKKVLTAGVCAVLLAVVLVFVFQQKQPAKESVRLIIKVPPLAMTSDEIPDARDAADILKLAGAEFAAQYDAAHVIIDVVKFDYPSEDRFITDCFDTKDAADVLCEAYSNMSTYIHTGRVVPLDDIIPEELRADIDKVFWEMSQVEGKTYLMPFYTMQNTLCYNKDLFRQCGLEAYIGESGTIQSWTPEEWDTILSTLAGKLPEMTYPMLMYGKNEQGDTHIMTLLRSRGCPLFDENGLFCVNTPEGIEALQWIQDACASGYFPANCESLEINDCVELFRNGQLAICMVNNATYSQESGDIGLVNFPSRDGRGYNTEFLSGFAVFDNGNPAKLAAAKAFLQFLYGSEKYMDCSRSAIPVSDAVAAREDEATALDRAYRENTANTVDITANNPNWRGVRNVFWVQIHDLLTGDRTAAETAEAIDRACNAAILEGRKSSVFYE